MKKSRQNHHKVTNNSHTITEVHQTVTEMKTTDVNKNGKPTADPVGLVGFGNNLAFSRLEQWQRHDLYDPLTMEGFYNAEQADQEELMYGRLSERPSSTNPEPERLTQSLKRTKAKSKHLPESDERSRSTTPRPGHLHQSLQQNKSLHPTSERSRPAPKTRRTPGFETNSELVCPEKFLRNKQDPLEESKDEIFSPAGLGCSDDIYKKVRDIWDRYPVQGMTFPLSSCEQISAQESSFNHAPAFKHVVKPKKVQPCGLCDYEGKAPNLTKHYQKYHKGYERKKGRPPGPPEKKRVSKGFKKAGRPRDSSYFSEIEFKVQHPDSSTGVRKFTLFEKDPGLCGAPTGMRRRLAGRNRDLDDDQLSQPEYIQEATSFMETSLKEAIAGYLADRSNVPSHDDASLRDLLAQENSQFNSQFNSQLALPYTSFDVSLNSSNQAFNAHSYSDSHQVPPQPMNNAERELQDMQDDWGDNEVHSQE